MINITRFNNLHPREPNKGLIFKISDQQLQNCGRERWRKNAVFQPCFAVFRPKRPLKIRNSKNEIRFFSHSVPECVCKISGQYLKNCGRYAPDIHTPYIHTYIHTYRQTGETGETRGKPSTSQSSVPVSIQYQFVKQYSLVISTGF